VTNLKNIELQVRVADCGNIYAYDYVAEVIWVCHSGRQGSRKNIINTMLQNMKSLWSHVQDIVVRTWPCISWKNYQFWPEVKDLFEPQYYTLQWESYYLNLPKLHRDQLISTWILSEHIIQSDICTFDTLELPSYRRQWPNSGRITWSIMQIE
jgi:copper oxidase (laccase) domain-containing protein